MSDTSGTTKRKKINKATADDVAVSSKETKTSPNSGGSLAWIALAFIVGGGAILLYAIGFDSKQPKTAAVYQSSPPNASSTSSIGGPFTLVDQDGKTVTNKDYLGNFLLIYFGYTFCPDVCPTTLTEMSVALDLLGDDAEKIIPMLITIDPDRDLPEHLKEYVAYFHPRLRALTGTPEQVDAAAKAYRVYYAKAKMEEHSDPDDYHMDHSSVTYLMGPDGTFRLHFSHGTDAKTMAQRIREKL